MDVMAILDWLTAHWEWVVILILTLDKVVALTPCQWDDLIWTGLKKALLSAVGKKVAIVVPLLLTVSLAACGTKGLTPEEAFVKTGWQTLAVAGQTYDTAIKAAADAWESGLIDEAGKARVIEYGTKFHGAYHLAREALTDYATALRESGDDAQLYRVAATAFGEVWARLDDLIQYARDVGVKLPEGI